LIKIASWSLPMIKIVKLPTIIQKHGKKFKIYLKIKRNIRISKNMSLGLCYVKIIGSRPKNNYNSSIKN